MRKILKIFLALALVGAALFALGISGSAVTASERGLTLSKGSSYTKDGKYYVPLTLKTGALPYGSNRKTKMNLELYNSSGKRLLKWDQVSYNPNTTVTREPNFYYTEYPSGTYTLKVTCYLYGEEWIYNGYSPMAEEGYVWNISLNLSQPATVSLKNVEVVRRDDGSYANKIIISHSGAKGQVLNLEIYDPWGRKVYSTKGSPISYTSGTYSFTWGGYPSGGGVQCDSGEYTIKYWLDGKNAKQSKYYLSIY